MYVHTHTIEFHLATVSTYQRIQQTTTAKVMTTTGCHGFV